VANSTFILNPARVARTVLMRSSNQSLFGNCDSFRLETCLNYLTRLGTVSHRSWPPIPHSHLARANAPEEPVNSASAIPPFGWFKRSRTFQPDPTFPRSPGIILETNNKIHKQKNIGELLLFNKEIFAFLGNF